MEQHLLIFRPSQITWTIHMCQYFTLYDCQMPDTCLAYCSMLYATVIYTSAETVRLQLSEFKDLFFCYEQIIPTSDFDNTKFNRNCDARSLGNVWWCQLELFSLRENNFFSWSLPLKGSRLPVLSAFQKSCDISVTCSLAVVILWLWKLTSVGSTNWFRRCNKMTVWKSLLIGLWAQ